MFILYFKALIFICDLLFLKDKFINIILVEESKYICKSRLKNCKTQSRILKELPDSNSSQDLSSDDETPIPNVPKPISPEAKNYSKMRTERSPGGLFSQHYERSSKSVAPSASKAMKENISIKDNSEETPANEFSLDNFIQQKANKFIANLNSHRDSERAIEDDRQESRNSKNPYITPTK